MSADLYPFEQWRADFEWLARAYLEAGTDDGSLLKLKRAHLARHPNSTLWKNNCARLACAFSLLVKHFVELEDGEGSWALVIGAEKSLINAPMLHALWLVYRDMNVDQLAADSLLVEKLHGALKTLRTEFS